MCQQLEARLTSDPTSAWMCDMGQRGKRRAHRTHRWDPGELWVCRFSGRRARLAGFSFLLAMCKLALLKRKGRQRDKRKPGARAENIGHGQWHWPSRLACDHSCPWASQDMEFICHEQKLCENQRWPNSDSLQETREYWGTPRAPSSYRARGWARKEGLTHSPGPLTLDPPGQHGIISLGQDL